jgi:hypothetical protein
MTIGLATTPDPEAAAFFADARAALAQSTPRPPSAPPPVRPKESEPDLSDLTGMPPSAPPDRRLLEGSSWLGTGIYLTAFARHEAAKEVERAVVAQTAGGHPTEVIRILARAENSAPAKDKAWHAARLDAYAAAHGVRGWYRKEGRDGARVCLMVLRTCEAGDRGRYYAHESSGMPRPALPHWVVDRDSGRTAYRSFSGRIAQQWIDERENTPTKPALIVPVDDDTYRAVSMPVRL